MEKLFDNTIQPTFIFTRDTEVSLIYSYDVLHVMVYVREDIFITAVKLTC